MKVSRRGRRPPAILQIAAKPGERALAGVSPERTATPAKVTSPNPAKAAWQDPVSSNQVFEEALGLHQAGRLDEAACLYERLLAANPRHAGALHLLGMVAYARGELETAERRIVEAIGIDSRIASFHANLGNVLLDLGRAADAESCYRRALELEPESGSAWSNLAYALLCLRRRDEALAASGRAVALLPGRAEALTNRANILLETGRIEEAEADYREALALKPGYVAAVNNLGTVRLEQGDFDAALRQYDAALALAPQCAEALLNRSVVELLRGDFAAGWPDYEARMRTTRGHARGNTPRRGNGQPQWRGEPLRGARILLYAEQGLGDCIQFLRYVPLVEKAGGRVVLEVPQQMRRLAGALGRSPGRFPGRSAQVISYGDPMPEFDCQCPLMSLPLAFGTRLTSIPTAMPGGKPYLTIPEEERQRAAARPWPESGLRVGLVWAGTPDHPRDWARSMPLDQIEPLLDLPGVHFFSLQVGAPAAQRMAWPQISELALDPGNLADTAAKILHLDLVIGVDTAVVHLAGALGKPVWVMLPWVPDWRWLLERDDSPWYPSMRLFRQRERGAWAPVVARVREALEELAALPRVAGLDRDRELEKELDRARTGFSPSVPAFLPVESPAPAACKICGGASELLGVVDFHKSCVEAQGKRLRLSGIPVYYRRCGRCGFVFTGAFDRWTEAEFAARIYNRDYGLVDPDFAETRPANNARLLMEAFAGSRDSISILDYGGGSGRLGEILRREGFNAATYDPFSEHRMPPEGRFDLMTCFEVMEHAPQPLETLRAMDGLLKEDGLILFSTLLQPKDFDQRGLSWWYVGPRNGHCSLYSAEALVQLFASVGMTVASWNEALHLAYRRVPAFAAHLRIGA
jgi:tetratricopeptide (TPR) repeat protein/SAM-dependent methyltransferase